MIKVLIIYMESGGFGEGLLKSEDYNRAYEQMLISIRPIVISLLREEIPGRRERSTEGLMTKPALCSRS